jgi:NTP pyrophosphatase (non-canonical NTP hydrolase)
MHYTNTDNPIDFPKVITMDSQTKEVMDIAQEECAEVIQAISKISRFGLDNLKPGKPKTNREHLEEELGDLLAMVDILKSMEVISMDNVNIARKAKIEKLKKWSNIQNLENI